MIASNKSFKILLDLMGKKSFPTTIFRMVVGDETFRLKPSFWRATYYVIAERALSG